MPCWSQPPWCHSSSKLTCDLMTQPPSSSQDNLPLKQHGSSPPCWHSRSVSARSTAVSSHGSFSRKHRCPLCPLGGWEPCPALANWYWNAALSLYPVTSLCLWRRGLRGALFYVFIVRGRLVTFTLALGIWSVLVSGKGWLLWGLRRRGRYLPVGPQHPQSLCFVASISLICVHLLENTETSRNW